jgi:hypothetical protein
MACLCSQWTPNIQINYFMYDWSVYRLFVLNTAWKRDSLQMILVIVCSKWSVLPLKTRFETSITRNNLYGVSLLHFSYLITLMAYLCSQRTPNVQINYFMLDWSIYTLFVLEWLETSLSPNDDIRNCLFDMKHGTSKNFFWSVNKKNDVYVVCLFHFSYLITLMAYVCSQKTPNAQFNSFMLDWSIYTLFVLNRCWKRGSLQIMIFLYVCSTWSIVDLKHVLRRE